jgi:DNA-damage-inducible protein D
MIENKLANIALFDGKKIRKVLVDNEWWFSVVDVISVLTDSQNSRDYWHKMKTREKKESEIELSTICRQFKLMAPDGKQRATDCASLEGIFRIIQSVPSPKAESFKQWLARVGKERIQELENPELAIERARLTYEKKGYPKDWIEKRIQSTAIRQKLTDEWKERGAKSAHDYSLLTNEIMQNAFGKKVDEHKKYKGLDRENLRDHMTDLELVIGMLGEATATKLHKDRDSQGMKKLKKDANDGGLVAGRTRKDIEKLTGSSVVSKDNFLPLKRKSQIKQSNV